MQSIFTVILTIWSENKGADRLLFLFHGFLWQLRKRLGHPLVTRLANGMQFKAYPHSAFSAAFYVRWVERKDLLFIRKFAGIAPVFVDVGANVGLFSASLFDAFSHCIMIEPSLACVTTLHETCALNPSVNCDIVNAAVSDHSGEAPFLDEGSFSTTSRIVDGSIINQAMSTKIVPIVTLDQLLEKLEEDLIVKVDVEGHEEQVFRGAMQLFRDERIKLLMFERLGRTNIDRLLTFFATVNYVVFFVLDDGTITFEPEIVKIPLINLFACPQSVFPRIAEQLESHMNRLR